ncbi:Peptidoglycan/LPS O-acetylase OafA/YrhL, contains acyltransferase and SGNH-hydrolase domains [Novosphingobium sp. CF614]|uniref:acyltransferase family protein n=1 Tax=Novosphingobium sp. CF614 TaxID=1884364 RepID=UPI0008F18938|nr:acyltransferase [Novosphingobium sp. CF614]SFF86844.1 Peptidoglycan/LPS O-acetylase OafA/YrhL, contains acyltransferase and SGNH-hydrolase domains [Novosphingobium sp. CF614]
MSTGRTREVSSLDVMRLLAAQAVMFYHLVFLSWAEAEGSRGIRAVVGNPVVFADATAWASLGWVGVQIFFVISGFVILMSAQDKSAADFLIGRVTRIAPALWVFSVLSALVLLACGVLGPAELAVRMLRSMILFPIGPWVDGAVWTLVAEAMFYAAIFVFIRTGMIGRMTSITLVMTVFNLAFWGAVLAGEAGALGEAGHRLAGAASSYKLRVTLISTNCYFVVGASLYGLFMRRSVAANLVVFAANYLVSLVATYYAALSNVGVSEFGQDPVAASAVWGGVTLVMSACVLGRVGSGPRFVRFATIAGLLTYPLYLINQIIGGFLLGLAYRGNIPPAAGVILTAVLCTVLAGIFALFIERGLQRRLSNFLKQFKRPAPALSEA